MNALFWFRDDLRLQDNPGLFKAINQADRLILIYILDETTPSSEQLGGASKWWLHQSLQKLQQDLEQKGQRLILKKGNPTEILNKLVHDQKIESVFWNRSYTPHSIARDTSIKTDLKSKNINVHTFPGNVLIEPFNVKNKSEKPYLVFTPFYKSYLMHPFLGEEPFNIPPHLPQCFDTLSSLSLDALGLLPQGLNWADRFPDYWIAGEKGAWTRLHNFLSEDLQKYRLNQDLSQKTSLLSPYLRWGEISVRRLYHELTHLSIKTPSLSSVISAFQRELIWRDFASHLLYHFPNTVTENHKPQFNAFPWIQHDDYFKAWTKGKTGYPIVDAGMRQLWQTGFMHNRVRMIVGSFLVKHLLIDWRFGERWFWDTLLDADLASNIMNWQWVAGSGADASPYFRIFNPLLQAQKFDPKVQYIKEWVPELRDVNDKAILEMDHLFEYTKGVYPRPIVKHEDARNRALLAYKSCRISI
ncbi:MAG: deoxyribodipyrimidine photo-lyase [Alphaproteobacteria bacterium]|nr:deoxyribodipyrimidine photo-lyase [Alphaproteobacteria bacterium]